MRSRLAATVCAFLVAGLLSAADQQLLNLIMPEAKAFAGINIEQARSSPFGQFVMSQMGADNTGFQEFVIGTGFDPRHDLKEVLIASTGEPGHKAGLVLIRGSFDVSRILAAIQSQGQLVQNYGGVDMVTVKSGSGGVAFLDNSIAIAGDPASLRAAIDRRSAPSILDSALLAKINELSGNQDIWGLSVAPISDMGRDVPDKNLQGVLKGDLFKKIEQTSGGVKFGSNVQVAGEAVTASDKDASALADVVRFLANMAQLNAPKEAGAFLSSLLQTLVIKADAKVVKVSMAIPEEQLEEMIHSPRRK